MAKSPIKIDDPTLDMGRPLKERYEDFCGHFVATRNPLQAYRLAFVVDKAKAVQWVHDKARQLLKDPAIMARVQQLRDDAAAQTLVTVQSVIQDYHDIATADPNELMSYAACCCRHCWEEDDALTAAEAISRGDAPPDQSSYERQRESNLQCSHCGGAGSGQYRVVLRDTRTLSPGARKLLKAVKETQTKFGTNVEVQVHDQMAARDALGRILGAFKDGIPVSPAVPNAQAVTRDMKEQDAGRAYLQLIQGGKA